MEKGLSIRNHRHLFYGVLLLLPFLLAAEVQGEAVTSIRLVPPAQPDPVVQKIMGVFTRQVLSRCDAAVITEGEAPLKVELVIEAGIGAEGFQITDSSSGVIRIRGNDQRGLLYGVGKFLHTSAYGSGGFTAGSWRGVSVPVSPVRGIYLATHFQNYYQVAPVEEVTNYIEDLSLWGANSFLVWFGMEEFRGIDDLQAQAMLARLRVLLQIVKNLGLNPSLVCVSNEGYRNSPVELRADDSTVNREHYHTTNGPRIYNLGFELCPSKPGVPEMELGYVQEKFSAFQSVGLDYFFIWPYDSGGCTCPQCAPWGSNGYLKIAELEAQAYRNAYPQGKVVLSTWYFDRWAYGEWEGITAQFNQQKPDWVDYILIDNFEEFPAYPLAHGVPGGLPALNFPDISMWGQDPWGGYGANPMPGRLQQRWDQTRHILSGGFPYSEGIYEDINKVICSQLYWEPNKPTMDTVGEYIAFEFSPQVVDEVKSVVDIFETNHWRNQIGDRAVKAWQLLEQAGTKLTPQARSAWRWRLFCIRAALDQELYRNTINQGRQEVFNAAYEELIAILHAENTWPMLRPVLIHATGPTPAPMGPMEQGKLDADPNMDPPPADCPFPQSTEITGIAFTGKYATYNDDNKDLSHMIGDTWYPSWAADGKLYSPWTDGFLNGVTSASWSGTKATTGHAAILGENPLHLTFTDAGIYQGSAAPYSGRYPCANLVYNGVWYYGTYCLNDSDGDPCAGLNWDILGPFVGFRYSTDYGKTWTDTPHTPECPLFGEPARVGGPLKMGVPHIVDFGKNMQYSPDGKAYLVGHGTTDPDPNPRAANLSWVTGDQIYMARVLPSPQNINDVTQYEFFAGHDGQGKAIWTHDFSQIKPLVDWNNHCGGATITYNPGLKKYLMCVNDGVDTISKMNTYILESDLITGPWKLAVYMQNFGEQAYFANIPSKFISADGRTAWLCYSANFTNIVFPKLPKLKFDPPAGHPAGEAAPMVWQEIQLLPLAETVKSLRLVLPPQPSPVVQNITGVLVRQIESRCEAKVVREGDAPLTVELMIESGIGEEGFQIADGPSGSIRISGNDNRGLLYGVGKFLHTSSYGSQGFTSSTWRGVSVPKMPVRGMYLATHMQNFYHVAPIEEVTQYIEDLSLWGVNSFLVWFDLEVYNGINDPEAQKHLDRLRALLKIAKDLDLNASLGCIANGGYKDSPAELRAEDSTVNRPHYHTANGPRIYIAGPELCPSKPGVPEMEMGYCQEKFEAFQSVGLDYWFIAPYDNGGCTCPKCAPWGANGYLRMAEPIARAYKKAFPQGKVILSTWYFDRWGIGEWDGITARFKAEKPDWVDYIMCDNFEEYPRYPLDHGVPGGLPLLNFPDISMYGQDPWGGYGANPHPGRLQQRWDQTREKLSGGFPYSEGIYEDINKVICARLWWDPDRPAIEAVKDYATFEFSPEVADDVAEIVNIFEKNHLRSQIDASAVTAYQLLEQAEMKLTPQARSGWRWRLFRVRATLDQELYRNTLNQGRQEVFQKAYEELLAITRAENAWPMLRPVLIQAVGPAQGQP